MTTQLTYQKAEVITASPRDYIEPFVGSLDRKPRTLQAYRKNLTYYMAWLEETGRTGGDRADVMAYKAYLIDRYEASTVSAYLSSVRAFYTWLEDSGLFPNIARHINGPKAPQGFRKDPLTVNQVRQVLGGIVRDSIEGLRDYALINLLIRTGLRTIEAQRANVEDLRQMGDKTVLWIQGKGRDEKDNFVVLMESAVRPILDYLKARHVKTTSSAPLFASESNRNQDGRLTTRSISRIIKDAMLNAGIDSDRLTAHSLRHTAVTLALIGGATIQEAQSMARHADINTTMIYAHNIDRLENSAESHIDALLG